MAGALRGPLPQGHRMTTFWLEVKTHSMDAMQTFKLKGLHNA